MPRNAQPSTDESNRAAAERARILAAFRASFTSESGRTCLAVLQSSAGCLPGKRLPPVVYTTGGAACPIASAFRAGRQSILDEIDAHLAVPEDATPSEPEAKR